MHVRCRAFQAFAIVLPHEFPQLLDTPVSPDTFL